MLLDTIKSWAGLPKILLENLKAVIAIVSLLGGLGWQWWEKTEAQEMAKNERAAGQIYANMIVPAKSNQDDAMKKHIREMH